MTLMAHRPTTHDHAPADTQSDETGSPAPFVLPSHAIARTVPGVVATMGRGDRFLHGSVHHVVEIEIVDDHPTQSTSALGDPIGVRKVRRHDTGALTDYQFTGDGPCAQALICPEHGGALGMKPGCFTCAPVVL